MDPNYSGTAFSPPSMHTRRLSSARRRPPSDLTPIHEEGDDLTALKLRPGLQTSRSVTVLPSASSIVKNKIEITNRRHRHAFSLPENLLTRSSSISKIVMATDARCASPAPSLSTVPKPETPVEAPLHSPCIISLLGHAECLVCISRPTHTLIPCQHTVCYNHHLLGFNQEKPSSSLCARCHQVAEIKTNSPSTPFTSLSLSPQNSIWSAERSTSLSERVSKMIPPAYSQPWGHPGFIPQTPVQGNPPFPPPFVNQQYPAQQYPAQQHPNQQHPTRQYPTQQYPTQQHQTQPYPPRHFGAPPTAYYPNQPTAHYPVHPNSSNVHGGQFARSAHIAHPVPFPFAQNGGHQMNRNNGPMGHVKSLSDPFIQDCSSSSSTDMHRQGSVSTQTPSSSSSATDHSEDHRAAASILAQQIKQGLFEEPDNGGRRSRCRQPQFFQQRSHDWQLHQPVQPLQQPFQSLARHMVVTPDMIPDPPFMDKLPQGYCPSAEEAFDHIPFVELYKMSKPCQLGVVKISNIPYGTTKNEIVAALGRNARLANQPAGMPYYAVHIIMDRSTGKTMDCFAEMATELDATSTVDIFQQRLSAGRAPKIGDRNIDITVSSQADLMKGLFPRARCVNWDGQSPTVYQTDEPFNSGFLGFLTNEEMVMCQKHAEVPQRSPFAQRCHNRTYESLISTLHKYPWFSQDYVTLGERMLLFNTTVACVRALTTAIGRNFNMAALTPLLLQEVLTAALTTPGFSPKQKNFICEMVQNAGFANVIRSTPFVYLGPIISFWPFEIVDKKSEASVRILEYYVTLLREGSASSDESYQLTVYGANPNSPFGNLVVDYGNDKGALSLKKAAVLEWNAIESAICNVLPFGQGQGQALTLTQIQDQGEDQAEEEPQDESLDQTQAQLQSVIANGTQ